MYANQARKIEDNNKSRTPEQVRLIEFAEKWFQIMNDKTKNCKQDMENEEDIVEWGDLNSSNLSEEQLKALRVMR